MPRFRREKATKKTAPKKKVAPKKAVPKKEKVVLDPEGVTFLREGSVSGEYIFKEIPGSVAARSLEEAIEKAKQLIRSRSDLDFAKEV